VEAGPSDHEDHIGLGEQTLADRFNAAAPGIQGFVAN